MRKDYDYTQDDLDNHSNQMNPNNDEYYNSRSMDDDDFDSSSSYESGDYGGFITDDFD